ncbi:hypothetical protein BJV74DRAFT_466417 [Russula compacta]|nr:hypothetical protein BJV74DRAFT_466417 [Russula compacta]
MSSTTTPLPNFRSIFNDALDSYAKQTGIDLTSHPSADRLRSCNTSEAVLQSLQERESAFNDYRNKNQKLINCLRPIVQVVHAFSGILADVASLVPFQPTNTILTGIDVLLTAALGVSASYDALVDLFDCVANFLKRLRIYTEITLDPTMTHILVTIMVEVLFVLALATKQIKQGRKIRKEVARR